MKFEPGIYFGLPEDAYHSVPALSNSGIRNLLISPLDFWARSWMSPDYEPEETEFMRKGSAYHRRVLEGREAFYRTYAPELRLADHPEALVKSDEIKNHLRSAGLKLSGNKPELIERLLAHSPDIKIWDVLKQRHEEANANRQLIPAEWVEEIEICAAHIEKHPDLSRAFSGGYPEVSIFWETEDGIPMKARLDYLKPKAVVDLKTFSNPLGKPIDRAITTAMAGGRYHIQAFVYHEAVDAAKRLWAEGRVQQYQGGAVEIGEFLDALRQSDQTFLFVFQATGIAPVARGKVFPKGLIYDCAGAAVAEARQTFKWYMEKFGSEPWVDQTLVETFTDEDFPIWMTEI